MKQEQLPGVLAHVLHWTQRKVWFEKKEHKIGHDVQNAVSVLLGAHGFVQEMFSFLDANIQELVKCKVVVKPVADIKLDVLAQLNWALKAGSGKDLRGIIMDIQPGNAQYFPAKVQTEHIAQVLAVCSSGTSLVGSHEELCLSLCLGQGRAIFFTSFSKKNRSKKLCDTTSIDCGSILHESYQNETKVSLKLSTCNHSHTRALGSILDETP